MIGVEENLFQWNGKTDLDLHLKYLKFIVILADILLILKEKLFVNHINTKFNYGVRKSRGV